MTPNPICHNWNVGPNLYNKFITTLHVSYQENVTYYIAKSRTLYK